MLRSLLLVAVLTPAMADAPTMPDLPHGHCADGPGAEGADSYFVGSLALAESAVKGTETWNLYANPQWKAKGGHDCQLTWNVTGTKIADVGKCASCDWALKLTAKPLTESSSCPSELVSGRTAPTGEIVGGEGTPWTETYAVDVEGQQITVYFAKSGRQMAAGTFVDNQITYITNHQCKWF